MSLPEVLLVLREDGKREASRALMALQTQALAAFAVWDKEAGRKLEQFRRSLAEPLSASTPEDIDRLVRSLAEWGCESTGPFQLP
jgi:hypothetical protein